jgi:hypothetical protein
MLEYYCVCSTFESVYALPLDVIYYLGASFYYYYNLEVFGGGEHQHVKAINQYPIPDTRYPIPNTQYPISKGFWRPTVRLEGDWER